MSLNAIDRSWMVLSASCLQIVLGLSAFSSQVNSMLKKSKSRGLFWSYQLNSTANSANLPQKWAKWDDFAVLFSWQLQNRPQDFYFFNCYWCQFSFGTFFGNDKNVSCFLEKATFSVQRVQTLTIKSFSQSLVPSILSLDCQRKLVDLGKNVSWHLDRIDFCHYWHNWFDGLVRKFKMQVSVKKD